MALCGAFLFGCVTTQQAQPKCYTAERQADAFLEKIRQVAPGVEWVELTPEQRERWTRLFNEAGKPTGYMYDRVGYFRHPAGKGISMVMIKDGCVWQTYPDSEAHLRFLGVLSEAI